MSRFSLPGALFFGLPLMTVAVMMAADLWYYHSTREYKPSDLVEVVGSVERTAYVPAPERGWSQRSTPVSHVDVWLKGREYPFRFFGAQWNRLSQLPRGARFSAGLDPDAMKSPLKPTFLRPAPCYVPLTVQCLGGWYDVRLSRHNEATRTNLQIMPWLCPIFALLGLFMSTYWFTDWVEREARSKYEPRRKPLKGRLSLRLLKPDR